MRLVIDANVLLASLLRASTTRALLLDPRLDLRAPEHLLAETQKHLGGSARLRRRIGLSRRDLTALLASLFSYVSVHPQEDYQLALGDALKIAPHPEDAPYLALALALGIPLWSNDAGMRDQRNVLVLTTADLVRRLS